MPTDAAAPVTSVEFTREADVATIRFVADKGPAVFSSRVLGELGTIVNKLREDASVRYVVFRGAGKVFVAGADIKEMSPMNEDQGYALSKHGRNVFDSVETLPQVTFAALNGHALGGGCELALACSFRIMSAGAKIGLPECRLGLIPGWGGTKRLPRLVPMGWALRMLYSGEPISAEQAEKIGLADEVVPTAEDIDAALLRWFAMLKPGAPHAIIRIKRAILSDEETRQFGLCFSCSDAREGMHAFIEKRSPSWAT